jgi:xanthine dehydrogenase large subunit
MGEVHKPNPHDSGPLHVAGTATYIDDVPTPAGMLHLAFGLATKAHARILSMDLTAARAVPGVVAVFTAADVPGENNTGPLAHDEPLLADGEVRFHGQPIFLVAAETREAARRAARLGQIDYAPLPALLTVREALAADSHIEPTQRMGRGDVEAALAAAPRRLTGELEIGGQEHFYLEGQIAQATPLEDGQVHVLSSTQHPSEVQHMVAHLIGRVSADVVVETRRLGGGFGGKETQASAPACACAMVAAITGRPARMRYDRDDDMTITGKRHDFVVWYDVGFDDQGLLAGLRITLASRCGYAADVSSSINDRAMFHADNAYWIPAVEILSHRLRTNTVSNTAYRGFGGPQGMVAIERIMDAIAADVGRDPLDVRRANLYAPGRDITPYGMRVADNVAPQIIAELAETARYAQRRAAVADFNARHTVLKKGIALTPVKFGISFTATHLNQAGALVLVYADGSIQLNHGGIEMGQGLYTKVAQVVADVFAVPLARIRVTATRTDKVPNTSATAASSGSDMNGMAAYAAASTIRDRLADFLAAREGIPPEQVRFTPEGVIAGAACIPFTALARMAYMARVQLWSDGFYATPKIHYDRASHTGHPFYYFAYGAACAEVVVDTLTGEHKVLAVDILHDCGRSLNPAIDLGQIEGGFIQGMGWLTTEELVFAPDGRLLTHAPSTYKIPTASDRPAHMAINLWAPGENVEPTIHRSKAVGEPPFMLSIAVFSALTEALRATRPEAGLPRLDAPATPERILNALAELAQRDTSAR